MIPSVQSTFLYRRAIPSRHFHLSLIHHLYTEACIRNMARHLIYLLASSKHMRQTGTAENLGEAYRTADDS